MHLGEIKFKKKSGKDDQAQPDGTEAGGNIAKLLGKHQNHAFFMMSYNLICLVSNQTSHSEKDYSIFILQGLIQTLFTRILLNPKSRWAQSGSQRVKIRHRPTTV